MIPSKVPPHGSRSRASPPHAAGPSSQTTFPGAGVYRVPAKLDSHEMTVLEVSVLPLLSSARLLPTVEP